MAAADPVSPSNPALLAATGCTDLKRAQKNLELRAGGPLTRGAFLTLLSRLLEALPFSLLVQHRKVLGLLLTVLFALRLGSGAAARGAGEQLQGDFARHTARVREPYEATVGGA